MTPAYRFLNLSFALTLKLSVLTALAVWATPTFSQDELPAEPRSVQLVSVPLPIDHATAQGVTLTLNRLLESAPPVARADQRPLVILKFETERGATGTGSNLSACLELARLLTSPAATSRLQTVTFIPPLLERWRNPNQPNAGVMLTGHAVLVAIAAEDLVIASGGAIGNANADEPRADPLTIDIYRNIAEARLTLPPPLVLAMVDPGRSLYAVQTNQGEMLLDQEQLQAKEKAGEVVQSETLNTPGESARFTASQLDRFSANVTVVEDVQQLAVRYAINPTQLQATRETQREWLAVQLNLPDYIDRRDVDFGMRAIENAILKDPAINLVIVNSQARAGDTAACLRFATYLADFDPEKVRVAVFVPKQSAGPAATIALAADHLLLPPEALLGGPYERPLAADELVQLGPELERIAVAAGRDPALFAAMLDPALNVSRWRHQVTGQIRMLTEKQKQALPDADQWNEIAPVDCSAGLNGKQLELEGIARALVNSEAELNSFYQLQSPPLALTPTKVDQVVQRVSRFLATPLVAAWLLFGAMFLISTEMSTPGVGVPGVLGTLCLILFFWSQYLGGNADWLEILLFVAGVIFILMELFLVPGTMVLGISGLLMVVLSIVLATQTFLIPRNSRELAQLPVSLGIACAAFGGTLVGLFLLRKFLPNAPFFKRLMLEPPAAASPFDDPKPAGDEFAVRVGERGVAISRLIPSGKARIGRKYVDVITDGLIVDPKTEIEVIEVAGNRVLVRPIK
ncbi:MAG: NfeD family protein [Planctomycetota bacterium]